MTDHLEKERWRDAWEHKSAQEARAQPAPRPSALPGNEDAERGLLSGCMRHEDVWHEARALLDASDFLTPVHRVVWAAMLDQADRGEVLDPVGLADRLRGDPKLEVMGGLSYLEELRQMRRDDAPEHALQDLNIVREKATLRRAYQVAQSLVEEIERGEVDAQEVLQGARARFDHIEERTGTDTGGFQHVSVGLREQFRELERAMVGEEDALGISSGFADIDELTQGWRPGKLIILAGRPGMGKSALAGDWLRRAALEGVPCGLFSLEMSSAEIAGRWLFAQAQVDATRAQLGQLSDGEWRDLLEGLGVVHELPLYVDPTEKLHVLELKQRARQAVRRHDLKMIAVDYLQLLGGGGPTIHSREQEIAYVVRELKSLAKELEIPVIALAQLNRKCENREDKRPRLSDLRESGEIEQAADIIGFIYRDEFYDESSPDRGIAEVIFRKNRGGSIGTVKLRFWAPQTRFGAMSHRSDESEEWAQESREAERFWDF